MVLFTRYWKWAAAVVVVLAVAGLTALLISNGRGDTGSSKDAKSVSDKAGGDSSDTESGDPTGAAGPDGPDGTGSSNNTESEYTVPLEPIGRTDEIEVCAKVVDRLEIYRGVAADSGVDELSLLFEAMSEFEADIFTLADNQEWGDRMIAQLVNVRREWADARAARNSGDGDRASTHAGTALELLDATIASADCPV